MGGASNDTRTGGFLVVLGEDGSNAIAAVGGKGASLGRLVKAGFPVPGGFVVTTAGYAECLRANGLKTVIEGILAGIDYTNLDQLETETERIRQEIVGCSLPDGLAGEIKQAYAKLDDEPYVAVRSSGTMEAYCVKCRAKREMNNAEAITMKNGKPATAPETSLKSLVTGFFLTKQTEGNSRPEELLTIRPIILTMAARRRHSPACYSPLSQRERWVRSS